MEQLEFASKKDSITRVIASSGVFQIELLEHVGENDFSILIEISKHLAQEYGQKAILTKATIHKYFNKKSSLPFIARYRGDIIGYIVGVPLEELNSEPWARMDENFGKYDTLYTYAFVIMTQYKGNGYAKMLKRVFLNWAKKRGSIRYITGHVQIGSNSLYSPQIKIISRIDNWQNTGKTFEYYRRELRPDGVGSTI
ncbi:MAG: GNAT family N-acetyltransferase [Planctomycetia bacterium]|nr:GNAT family N-acetyltransferase [Planctomycetia bacterium]